MTPEQLVERIKHDDISLVRFLYCDNANIVRGKAALAATLPNFLEAGIGLTVAMQGFTMTERIASDASVGPVGEIRLVPDPEIHFSDKAAAAAVQEPRQRGGLGLGTGPLSAAPGRGRGVDQGDRRPCEGDYGIAAAG